MAKEVRFFYDPQCLGSLPEDEAGHATRVLRLQEGDEIFLMDGQGAFHRAEITLSTKRTCDYRILESLPQQPAWRGHIHLAIAPTKNVDRIEWMTEKATEIGWNEVTFLDCAFSERRHLRTDRLRGILVSAAKQSHKAWMPTTPDEMIPFRSFVEAPREGQRFICHCYDSADVSPQSTKPLLRDVLSSDGDATVMVGPEGDFSIEEVRLAEQLGWQSVSLGTSRLRTETAGLCAVHLMQLFKQI